MDPDPIIDLIIRLKNACDVRKERVNLPMSKYRLAVIDKLKGLGFVSEYRELGEGKIKNIDIKLDYSRLRLIKGVKIFSTPGRRVYVTEDKIKPVLSGFGYALLSTSKGILTNIEAKKNKVGGELLFYIW